MAKNEFVEVVNVNEIPVGKMKHVEVDGKMTLEDAHIISDELEKKIEDIFPNSEVLIHQDPVHTKN